MKRAFLIFLVLAMLMSFTACTLDDVMAMIGGSAPQTPTESEPTEPPAAKTDVPKPYTKAEMEALKVAKPGMTEEELRQIVLDYMRAQCYIVWTPSETFSYTSQTTFKKLYAGKLFGGMPYISERQSSLYAFMHFYDERNGMLDMEKLMSYDQWEGIIANQCSGATFWAWSRVSESVDFSYCNWILPAQGYIFPEKIHNILKDVDKYYYTDPEQSTHTFYDVCEVLGEQAMYEMYKDMEPADGLVCYTAYKKETAADGTVTKTPSAAGHVIMCSSVHVEYDANGNIDGAKSYATILDQTLAWKTTKLENGVDCDVYPNWDNEFSFHKLYVLGYMPFTLPEFTGADDVELATAGVVLNGAVPDNSVSISELKKMNITSNYPISYYTVSVKDTAGAVLYTENVYVTAKGDINIKTIERVLNPHTLDEDTLKNLANGENTVEITVRVGTGEVLTAYTGVLDD